MANNTSQSLPARRSSFLVCEILGNTEAQRHRGEIPGPTGQTRSYQFAGLTGRTWNFLSVPLCCSLLTLSRPSFIERLLCIRRNLQVGAMVIGIAAGII